MGNLNHPNSGVKLLELDPPKGLGEEVGKLVLGVDVADLDAPLIQAAPDEVVLDADMLAALMEDGVLRPAAEPTRELESKRLWQRCTTPRNWTEPPLAA
jgi:hypothetical protein